MFKAILKTLFMNVGCTYAVNGWCVRKEASPCSEEKSLFEECDFGLASAAISGWLYRGRPGPQN